MKTANLQIQAQQIPGPRNLKKTTSSNIIFKLLKTHEKEKPKELPEKKSSQYVE